MAELQKNIKRPNGDVVSHKRPHGRRLLLPTEIELCDLLGLTEEEYWYFLDTTAAYNGTRPEGYELIPDIRCDPVSALITSKVLVQIGIAVVAATVSYLLTPKPKEQKQGGSRRTADSVGNKRFAPQASFDSIQELAILGDAIPLIFANTDEKSGFGGVRVNSQLLWSQFLSMGKYQQLKVLGLFSLGKLGLKPDYKGFGIGDTLLSTYNSHKVGLYFKDNGGRFSKNERYSESDLVAPESITDPFIVNVPDTDGGTSGSNTTNKAFSGARNPATQVSFGVFAPVPNCQVAKLPYELCVAVRGTSKQAGWDLMRKRKKVEFAHWPTRAGIVGVIRNGQSLPKTTTAPIDALVGDVVIYQIVGETSGVNNALQRVYDTRPDDPNKPETIGYQEEGGHNFDAWGYKPHGVDDVDSMTISIRENADQLFAKGEQYICGTAIMQCTEISDPVPYTIKKTKSYNFKIIEAGKIDIPVDPDEEGLGTHCNNPKWLHPPSNDLVKTRNYSLSDTAAIFYRQELSGVLNFTRGTGDLYHGHDIYTCQRVALATVSNNKDCDVTEIGIKSKVHKQMRFANINSQPGQKALDRAYDDRTQIQLGQVDRFLPRMSFFMLQVRRLGETNWSDMKNGVSTNHTGLFAVRGNTPEFQYNAITIQQPMGQFEYRFKPYPGNFFTRGGNFGKTVNLLIPTTDDESGSLSHFSHIYSNNGFNVLFRGQEDRAIDENDVYISNKEWNIEASTRIENGKVTSVALINGRTYWKSDDNFDGTAQVERWVSQGIISNNGWRIKYNDPSTNPYVPDGQYVWNLYPSGADAKQTPGGDPGPGVGNWTKVFFISGNTKYRPVQNAQVNHPNDKYYLFYVEQLNKQIVTPTPYFEGEVVVYHGQNINKTGYVGWGVQGTLKVYVKVYRDKDASNNWGNKYHIEWSLSSNPLFRGEGYTNAYTNGLYIPKYANGTSGTQILPEPLEIQIQVGQVEVDVPGKDLNRFDVIKDWSIYEGDVNSNKNEPEHQICYVNEIIRAEANGEAKYTDLAYAGLVINSSKEWTNFSQFSAYFKKGIEIDKPSGATGSSNLFPEIAYALLTSTKIGSGKLVGTVSVDASSMDDAAKFCKANDFFWDGVISSKLNLRDFIFEHAGYCLLDFTIIGGKFSLKPSVPFNNNNEIDKSQKPEIKCLFTDGNINDLQVSFLSPEERQLFRAAVLFRKETENGFPETKSVLVQSTFGTVADPIETFDMSGFCTSSKQAITFAKYAINLRRLSDHGLSFKTAPQYIQFLAPGDYFRLVSEVTHTSRFRNGAKLEDGTIVSKDDMTGNEDVLYWIPGKEGEILPSKLSAAPSGCLFTVKNTTTESKVYKCESISYAEDGLVEVSGSYAPTEADGTLSVLQNWDVQFSVLEN